MDRIWLEHELAAGRSIESIAREVGLHPTTVAYWMRKYGLISRHTVRHRSRGALGPDLLAELVDSHLSVREIAAETGRSPTTVRYWLAQYGLETTPVLVVEHAGPPHGKVTATNMATWTSCRMVRRRSACAAVPTE